ncbi:MAG: hypothetical protein LBC78_04835 [Oscillospiraceae bacterium]|jgi:hypothetical protein|nr:hypothetical protein [Oscillospiraceae bacterium]
MRKIALASTMCLVTAAAAGFAMRRSQLHSVFEAESGLAVSGAVTTTIILGYCALIFACALTFSIMLSRRVKPGEGYRRMFRGADASAAVVSLMCFGVMCWCAFSLWRQSGALLRPGNMIKEELSRGRLLRGMSVLCFLSGIAFTVVEFAAGARRADGLAKLFAFMPELFCTVWLIELYRANQTNPELLTFGFSAAAIVCAAMSFYYTAGAVFSKNHPGRAAFFHICGVFLCAVALADFSSLTESLLYGAILARLLVNFMRLTAQSHVPESVNTAPGTEAIESSPKDY